MAYRTRNITLEGCLFWFVTYKGWNITFERASSNLWLRERGILHLKRACFDVSLIERGTLPLKHVSCGLWNGECQIYTALHVVYGLKNEE